MIQQVEPIEVQVQCRYRAIGKLVDPASGAPAQTQALLDRTAVFNTAVALVSAGKWFEFYIKEIWSR